MGKPKRRFKPISLWTGPPRDIKPKDNELLVPENFKKFLDEYYEKYIKESTLLINEVEVEQEDNPTVKDFLEKDILKNKEQVIDRSILHLIHDFSLPLRPKLIEDLKIYMLKKFGLRIEDLPAFDAQQFSKSIGGEYEPKAHDPREYNLESCKTVE